MSVPNTGHAESLVTTVVNLLYISGIIVKMAATKKGKWDEKNMKMAVDGMMAGKLTLREAAGRFSEHFE